MIMEDYVQESTGLTKKRFKDEVIVEQTDEEGRFWIEKGKEDLVRRLLREYRVLDPTIGLDPTGLQLPEESEPKDKGGRPRKGRPDTGMELNV